jgi:hypothetical protein
MIVAVSLLAFGQESLGHKRVWVLEVVRCMMYGIDRRLYISLPDLY